MIENIQRDDLTSAEIAAFVSRRMALGERQADIARRLGKDRAFVAMHAAVVQMPDALRSMLETSPIRGVYELYQGWRSHPEPVLAFCGARDRFTRAEAIAFVDSLKDTLGVDSVSAASPGDARPCPAPTDDPAAQTPGRPRAARVERSLDPPAGVASTRTALVASADALVRVGSRGGRLLLDRQADLGADHARIRYDDGTISTISQWWVSRSSSAVVILASPANTLGHSPKARLVVTTMESERGQMAGDPGGAGSVVAGRPDLHPLVPDRCLGAAAQPGAGARRPTRDGVPRRYERAGSPKGGWCRQKGGSAAERDHREALGRSRGGYGTKACVIADGRGRAIAFRLAPGQAHELPQAVPLLDGLPGVPKWVVGDRGYTSHAFREHIWTMGARPAIPPQRHEAPVSCPDWIYNNRNQVERLWARLKEWRAIATRYEKTAASFTGLLCLAAALDWLKR